TRASPSRGRSHRGLGPAVVPSPRHDAKTKPLGRSRYPVRVRVIAGALKGRRLVTPRGTSTRPTADQIRVALMDTLTPWLPDARVLDLFAGAGGVGLEALSRGALHATFVEREARAVAALDANIRALGVEA